MLPVIYRRYYFTAHVPPWSSGSDILSALFCGIPEVLGVRLALQMYQPWAPHAQLFSAFQTVDFCNGFQCCQKKLPWLQVRAALRCGDKYEHLECIRRYTGLVKWQQLALFYGLWPHSHYQQGWVYSNRHELFPIEQALSIVAYSQDVSATIVPFRTSCHAGHCCYVLQLDRIIHYFPPNNSLHGTQFMSQSASVAVQIWPMVTILSPNSRESSYRFVFLSLPLSKIHKLIVVRDACEVHSCFL